MIRVDVPAQYQDDPSVHVWSAYVPDIAAAAVGYSKAVYEGSSLSVREFEGARIRTAQINGCLVCQNWRAARDLPGYLERVGGDVQHSLINRGDPVPDETFYATVEQWRNSSVFSARERIAIEFADRMGQEPKSLAQDEEFWKRAHAHFSDKEIVDLAFSVGSWISMGRVAHVLGIDTTCAIAPATQREVA